MKIWNYSNSTNTIWLNFDCGEVEAETKEEAIMLAKIEITTQLKKANAVLKEAGFGDTTINIDFDGLEVTESDIPYDV
jgi:hypothetical protein